MKPYETSLSGKPIGLKALKFSISFAVVTFVFLVIAFATPYWFQSWPRLHSKFLRIGLWEACFAGFIHPGDVKQKAYYGCWWIYSKEYELIRFWLFPGWFIVVECFAILAVLTCLASILLHIWAYLQRKEPDESYPKWGLVFTTLTGAFQTAVVLIFGVSARVDWNWMPMQFFNYLSWSYGLAVVAAFFAFLTTVADYIYLQELRRISASKTYEVSSSVSGYLVRKI